MSDHHINSEIVDAYIKAVEGFGDDKTSYRQDIRHGLETVAPMILARAEKKLTDLERAGAGGMQ